MYKRAAPVVAEASAAVAGTGEVAATAVASTDAAAAVVAAAPAAVVAAAPAEVESAEVESVEVYGAAAPQPPLLMPLQSPPHQLPLSPKRFGYIFQRTN